MTGAEVQGTSSDGHGQFGRYHITRSSPWWWLGQAIERLPGKLDRSGGPSACWPWRGATLGGYGRMELYGNKKVLLAHRAAYAMENGPIPDGLYVCHRCDTPLCCNPAHLFLGTHADNMADKIAKGRQSSPRGERSPNARLTADDVRAIRAAAGSVSRNALARRYSVTPRAIQCVIERISWKHIA